MLNRVQIIGNLGADPEARTTQGGAKVVNLRVAVTEKWTQGGERKERTEWFQVVIWNEKVGEIAERYLRKGSKAFLEGTLQTRKWTDKDGNERYTTEMVIPKFGGQLILLDRAGDAGEAPQRQAQPAYSAPSKKPGSGGVLLDDEIPFMHEWR